MGDKSKIEWTDATWNPVTGCKKVSEGCRNCYMARTVPRFGQDPWKVVLHPDRLAQPLKWKSPRRIFVNSLSDLFHEDVPEYFIFQVLANIWQASQHTFQVLTKRPKRMMAVMGKHYKSIQRGPLENLWLGVSVENQATADERIPLLLQTPAAVRFVSAEPLLGPVSFRWAKWDNWKDADGNRRPVVNEHDGLRMIDWVIVGGESGPDARPMHPDWARSIRDQCQGAGVPYFFKQWGEWKPISEMSEPEHSALYVSNRKANPNKFEDQAVLDECHGRRCTVEDSCIRYDGVEFKKTSAPGAWELRDGHPAMQVFRIGKKKAGSMLDGREWKEWP